MAPAAPLTKQEIRAAKTLHRAQKHQQPQVRRNRVDVGCVIHGRGYDWQYVDTLFNMVQRNMSMPVTLHVWTEHDRSVPPQYVKHCLEEWPGISGPKKSWWYKLQMFNPQHFTGDLLYFDLDVVICNDINWIVEHDTRYFWTIHDFRRLYNPNYLRMNSSIMWWNVTQFGWVWDRFLTLGPTEAVGRYHGDQDFLQDTITDVQRRWLPDQNVQSWRWSAWDGGMNFSTRQHLAPGTGTQIGTGVSVLVFHGNPKPHAIKDAVIQNLWR